MKDAKRETRCETEMKNQIEMMFKQHGAFTQF